MKQNNGGENNNSSKLESDVARDISQSSQVLEKKSFELSKICFCFLDFRCKGNFELTIKTYPHGA